MGPAFGGGEGTLRLGHTSGKPGDRDRWAVRPVLSSPPSHHHRLPARQSRWPLCRVCVVCALGAALLSVSRLNCHPGNWRGEPQWGEGPMEPSPSSRASSGPPFPGNLSPAAQTSFLSLPECLTPQVLAGRPGLQLLPVLAALICPLCRIQACVPKPRHPCLAPPASALSISAPNFQASPPPSTAALTLRVLPLVVGLRTGWFDHARPPEELAPLSAGGATHLTLLDAPLAVPGWQNLLPARKERRNFREGQRGGRGGPR